MRYAKAEWERERNGWRSVVQLNIVRSIITIQKVIEAEMNGDVPADSEDDQRLFDEANEVEVLKFTDRHQLLMIRLAPLLGVEAELKHRIGEGTLSVPSHSNMSATPFDIPSGNQLRRKPEFSVRSWKDVVSRPTDLYPDAGNTVTSVLAGCKDDMKALWDDKAVRSALKRRRLQLTDSAGLYDSQSLFTPTVLLISSYSFLNDLDRIASWEYSVTDSDIVRARLRTDGIQEYRLVFKHGPLDNPKGILLPFFTEMVSISHSL
jgi:hypothetical protein